jgi:hypothetical protein
MKKYKARTSPGWLWLLGIGIFILAITVIPMFFVFRDSPAWVWVMNVGLGLLIGTPFIYIALQVRKISYIFHTDHLEISMGRLIRYKINFSEINELVKKNLTITLWSSMRLPGLALFKVPYADEGVVSMCATSASKNILLIKTQQGKYGITPLAETEFINSLTSKIK